ncbi:MAG: hypothetical protein AABW48_05015 [Nanoarchaeota archaeon]
MIKDEIPAIREYKMALEEYFKNKPKAKNDRELKEQMGEFMYWYNHVRKQSDTGKTPDEMYREAWEKTKMSR